MHNECLGEGGGGLEGWGKYYAKVSAPGQAMRVRSWLCPSFAIRSREGLGKESHTLPFTHIIEHIHIPNCVQISLSLRLYSRGWCVCIAHFYMYSFPINLHGRALSLFLTSLIFIAGNAEGAQAREEKEEDGAKKGLSLWCRYIKTSLEAKCSILYMCIYIFYTLHMCIALRRMLSAQNAEFSRNMEHV